MVWLGLALFGLVLCCLGSGGLVKSGFPQDHLILKLVVYLVHFRAISSFHHPSLRPGMEINSFAWIRTHQKTASSIRSESGETSERLSVKILI